MKAQCNYEGAYLSVLKESTSTNNGCQFNSGRGKPKLNVWANIES